MSSTHGDLFEVQDVRKSLPPHRHRVIAITSYDHYVEARYDVTFKDWRFDKKHPNEEIEFWLKKQYQ